MALKTLNGERTTTGAMYDRVNVKHAVKEFIKRKTLKGAISKGGYIIAPATHSEQIYYIARNGALNAAQVAKVARCNPDTLIFTGVIEGRAVTILRDKPKA